MAKKTISRQIAQEVSDCAHDVEGQGGGVYMVLIRLDEIERIVKRFRRLAFRKAKGAEAL